MRFLLLLTRNSYLDTVSEAEDKVFLQPTQVLQAVAMHLDSDFLQIFEDFWKAAFVTTIPSRFP